MQSTSLDSETFQQQALEVRQPGEDFDPLAEPTNGEEYLMRMLYERNRCPAVVVKRQLDDTSQNTQEIATTDVKDKVPVADSLLPTIEWKEAQASDFLATRERINQLRQQLQAQNYNSDLEPPLTTDAADWQRFCRQQPPLLSTILRINQRTLEQLLEMLCEWLHSDEEAEPEQEAVAACSSSSSSAAAAVIANACATLDLSSSDQWLGAWLYAALACLHLPLEPDVHSTLRDIARICIRLRSHLQPEELEKAVPYNLLIHLIAKVFDQMDFAEFV